MNKLFKFDYLLRILTSILYRLIILIYSIVLLSNFENYFAIYYYIIALVVYAISWFFLIGKIGWKSKLRLLIDLGLIFSILYSKPIDNISTIIFLLLPILNSPNNSDKKRSYFLLFIVTILTFYILIQKFQILTLVPFLALFLISYFEYYRSRALVFFYSLNSSVSELYESKKKFDAEVSVYEGILNRLNNSKFASIFRVNEIIYLTYEDGNYSIKNSSFFITTISLKREKTFFELLKNNEIFSEPNLEIENKEISNNLIVPVKINPTKSSFFILIITPTTHLANKLINIRNKYFLTPTLMPFFRQLSIFFESEYYFKRDRLKKFEKIKGEYDYVLRTINAVHFLRNRLSPFKNYLEMSYDLRMDSNIPEDIKMQLFEILSSENDKAKITLTEILTRVTQILEGTDNPFNVSNDIHPVKVKEVFSELRNLVSEILVGKGLETSLDLEDFEKEILISKKGMNIVFSDLLSNIRKHGTGNYNILFARDEETLLLTLTNSYPKSRENVIKDLIKYFDSEENYNIFKMSSKGAFLVKDFLRQMNIKHKMEVKEKNNTFVILLKFKFII